MRRWLLTLALCALPFARAHAGIVLEVKDPRMLERPVFPNAEVKIVTFEFTSVGTDQRGKARAKELHNELLSRIRDLSGGAIVTYVTPSNDKIDNLKVDVEKVARTQQAQMALWGRVLIDKEGKPLINARLQLITPPRGIDGSFGKEVQPTRGAPPLRTSGIIQGAVRESALDFNTLETDVTPLATFVSALARYYKADRAMSPRESLRWLTSSATEFQSFVTAKSGDVARIADALVYLARIEVRLADAEPSRKQSHLDAASRDLEQAARLDPYDPEVATAAAIVATRHAQPASEIRAHLARAATLAPADGDARLNLALIEAAQGNIDSAIRQADNARFVHNAQKGVEFEAARPVREQLREYQKVADPSH